MLRPVWYLINVFVLTVWYGTKVMVAAMLKVPNRSGGLYDQAARRWARKQLKAAGVPVTVVGGENLPRGQPVVYVSNHQSWFDILALAANLPGTVRFVSKKELARVPFLGPAMRQAGHIFIDRQNLQQALGAYQGVSGVIRGGMSAILFAEGTRSRTGRLQPFKKGPFVLAIAAQVPVVPVYCGGTFGILPKGSIWVRRRPVTLVIGEPIPTEGLDYEARGELLTKTRDAMLRLRSQAGEGNAE
ncbi:MAG: lysophospholipid acyltransferase family protein [Gemmatimonadales bacterium]